MENEEQGKEDREEVEEGDMERKVCLYAAFLMREIETDSRLYSYEPELRRCIRKKIRKELKAKKTRK